MPSYTGREIARDALREIGVLDPTETGDDENIADALVVGTDMLDSWRTEKNISVGGVTRTVKALTSGTQSYTIGSGGSINVDYPAAIPAWSVIPDRGATEPLELPMGRPYTWDQWQAVRIKSQAGSYPIRMYFDRAFNASGYGTCSFHPIQNVTTVDAVLYAEIPAITTLVLATTYVFRPATVRAIKLNLAVELGQGRYARRRGLPDGLERRAMRALGMLRRSNIHPLESRIRAEFIIGEGLGRRNFNVYTGGT